MSTLKHTDHVSTPLGKRDALRGSPAGTDAGGTQHGSCLGARSEHPRTSSTTALSVGLKNATVLSRTQKHRTPSMRRI